MKFQRCYRFRLDPTPEQEQVFRQFAGCRRYVWNWALGRKRAVYHETGARLSYGELAAELAALKRQPETGFLQVCNAQALQQVLRDLDRAFVNFFAKRSCYPKPKSRKRTRNAFRLPQDVRIDGRFVRLPKIGPVRARLHRQMEGTVKSATVKQAADGHWYVTFVCHCERDEMPATADRPAGIDVGLETFAAFDDGRKVRPPRFYRQQERKLKLLQRRVSRCCKGSRNRSKARRRLAVLCAKVRNQRHDFLHKLSAGIIRDHDTVCIEGLNLKGLVKTKRAKSFSDAAHGAFICMLLYKGIWFGCRVVKVDRFFASTKTCSCCGHRQTLSLSEREWICLACGAEHDRDVNAAKNLLAEGLRLLAEGHSDSLTACGEGVRLDMSSVPR